MEYEELSKAIIGCAYRVHNTMGSGFLESVYRTCMLIELQRAGLKAQAEAPIRVFYDGHPVGDFYADLLVEDTIIVELKAVRELATIHEVQLVNYLTAAHKAVGLLINFGEHRVHVRRKLRVLDGLRKEEQERRQDQQDNT